MARAGGIGIARGWMVVGFTLLVGGSCGILDPDEPELRVGNRTEATILFLAWDLEASHLLDLAPSIQIQPGDPHVLPPGTDVVLHPREVSGDFRIGRDLRVFLYEVVGDVGEYRSALTLTAEELRRADHRVEILGL